MITEPHPQVQALLDRYVALWEQADIPGLVTLLREDAWFTMPPYPVWVHGRATIATLFQTPLFTAARQRRLLPTRANGSPAFGLYQWEAEACVFQLTGLVVLGLANEQIAHIIAFLEPESFASFALPPTLPANRESTIMSMELSHSRSPEHGLATQSMTAPLEAFTIAPVMVRALSEARNAASWATPWSLSRLCGLSPWRACTRLLETILRSQWCLHRREHYSHALTHVPNTMR